MDGSTKRAPKNPPAESIHIHVSKYQTSLRVNRNFDGDVVQMLVRLLDTALCCALVIVDRPKSRIKLFCVIVVPMKAES